MIDAVDAVFLGALVCLLYLFPPPFIHKLTDSLMCKVRALYHNVTIWIRDKVTIYETGPSGGMRKKRTRNWKCDCCAFTRRYTY